jgi:NADH-quinone oxidoreductase subunit F
MWRVIERIQNGTGKPSDLDLLNSVADNIQGRTICALGDAAAMPVRAMIKHFRHEFEAKIARANRPRATRSRCRGRGLRQE